MQSLCDYTLLPCLFTHYEIKKKKKKKKKIYTRLSGFDTFSEETTLLSSFCSLLKMGLLKKAIICSPWKQSHSFWCRSLLRRRIAFRKANRKSQKLSPCQIIVENLQNVSIYLQIKQPKHEGTRQHRTDSCMHLLMDFCPYLESVEMYSMALTEMFHN